MEDNSDGLTKEGASGAQKENQEGAGGTGREKLTDRRKYIRDICYIALFAAVLTVCSWIAIPISEIYITLQTLGVCMAAGFLGWKRGTLCILVYALLGVCCVPVFSGFKNFYALIGSASAGYVVGFVFTALIVGATSDKLHLIGKRVTGRAKIQVVQLVVLAAAMVVGVAVCYVFGTLWYMLIFKGSVTAKNLNTALIFCVYPYLLPDFIKIVAATFLVNYLKRYVK